ncbi:hypothetical protein [Streptacidiphilus sp. MAP5-52]|uniref:hypothetical protein n=1 Tax=Streptacidiphilus sp. MAP5-52 TaxID=3156267 RepID=UPI0035174A64
MAVISTTPVRADQSVYAPVPSQAPSKPGLRPAPVRAVTRQQAEAARTALERLTKLGTMITRALMTIGGGALIFTCTNVMLFAMSRGVPSWIAWMLDPMASLALLTVLYVDGVLTEHGGERAGGWPAALRWFAGLATWLMNSWTSWYPDGRFHLIPQHPDAGGLLLHSVAPLLLILLAEASSGYRKYLAGRMGELRETVQAWTDQEQAAKAQREREERERREAAVAEERELRRQERERELERERLENEDRQREREERAALARLAAESERERERVALREREAEIEAAAEQRRIASEAERERARAEIERARREQEAEIERRTQEAEAAREAQLIVANGQAEALRIEKEAEVKAAAEELQRGLRQAALEQQERERRAAERAAARQTRATSQTVPAASRNRLADSSQNAAAASQNGGTVPRDVRSALREQAEREIARRILEGSKITPADQAVLANRYGKGETWVGDRVRTARRRLANDTDFELEVIASALEDQAPVSAETQASEPGQGDSAEQHERTQ